jgi:photosystem II stability/assembly factor-like uncharacterized protein
VQLYTIASSGKGVLVIAGNGTCLLSEDGGRTWRDSKFKPTIEYGWIYDVEALAPGRFTACGDEGAVYRKSSGSHWKRIDY